MIKKTSEEWKKELYPDVVILDMDGWNRSNIVYSYFKEQISEEEFKERLFRCTMMLATYD